MLLGAIGQATERIPIGTGVTAPVYRHNPAVVAQAFATLEAMFPGRAFLGIGSGESLNESPCGMDWPPVGEQIDRMEEALEIIDALLRRRAPRPRGQYFRTKARLPAHARPSAGPPIYVSAFGPRAAAVAARHGDGLWTLADPETAPEVIDAYRGACEDAGREPGEIVLQTGFSWAEDDDAALEGARVWKGDPAGGVLHRRLARPGGDVRARRAQVSDDEFKQAYIVLVRPRASTPSGSARWRSSARRSSACRTPPARTRWALEVYGEQVLPGAARRPRVGGSRQIFAAPALQTRASGT